MARLAGCVGYLGQTAPFDEATHAMLARSRLEHMRYLTAFCGGPNNWYQVEASGLAVAALCSPELTLADTYLRIALRRLKWINSVAYYDDGSSSSSATAITPSRRWRSPRWCGRLRRGAWRCRRISCGWSKKRTRCTSTPRSPITSCRCSTTAARSRPIRRPSCAAPPRCSREMTCAGAAPTARKGRRPTTPRTRGLRRATT